MPKMITDDSSVFLCDRAVDASSALNTEKCSISTFSVSGTNSAMQFTYSYPSITDEILTPCCAWALKNRRLFFKASRLNSILEGCKNVSSVGQLLIIWEHLLNGN